MYFDNKIDQLVNNFQAPVGNFQLGLPVNSFQEMTEINEKLFGDKQYRDDVTKYLKGIAKSEKDDQKKVHSMMWKTFSPCISSKFCMTTSNTVSGKGALAGSELW